MQLSRYSSCDFKAQKLEQKKDTKGLSKSEQAKLDKYNAELEALQKGGTGTNIGDYMIFSICSNLSPGLSASARSSFILDSVSAFSFDSYHKQIDGINDEVKNTQQILFVHSKLLTVPVIYRMFFSGS